MLPYLLRSLGRHRRRHIEQWRVLSSGFSTPSKFETSQIWSSWQLYEGARFFYSLEQQKEGLSKQEEALQITLSEISKTFGLEAVMWLGREGAAKTVPVISTGSMTLDSALGIGGLPKGRIVEIFGPEGSGKRILALHVIAEAQKTGGVCAFIDVGHSLNFAHAEAFGVSTRSLLVARPDTWQEALTVLEEFVQIKGVDLVVIDSLAALFPKMKGKTEAFPSLQALLGQTLRKLTHAISRNESLLIFMNQTRSGHSASTFEAQEGNSSGNALKCYSSVRLNVQKTEFLKAGKTLVKVVKNKLAPPFKTAEFEIEPGRGISKEGEVLDQALKYNFVMKSKNHFLYNGKVIGDNRESVKAFLKENMDVKENLITYIKKRLDKATEEH